MAAAGGTGAVTVQTARECQWTATAEVSWISIPSGASGQGSNTVPYTVAANGAASVRRGTIAINGQRVELTQEAAPCTASISTSALAVGSVGGASRVALTTQNQCAWTAVSRASWITVTPPANGSGSAEVVFEVAANSGAARVGTVEIAGQLLTVTQAAAATPGCSFTIDPATIAAGAEGAQRTVAVSAPANCAWSAIGGAPWINIAGASEGSGSGSIVLQISANGGAARTAQVSIAGQTLTVTQTGSSSPCSYVLNPTGHSVPAGGGPFPVTVTAGNGCSWATIDLPEWITVTDGIGSGTGTLTLNVQANSGPARSATLTIAGQSFTVNQGTPTPTCAYSLNPTSHAAPAAGGDSSVAVATGSGCSWTTSGLPSWITLTNGSGSGSGNGTVTFNVQANTGAARSATATIAGQSFTVNQAAATGCAYSLNPTTHAAPAAGGTTSVAVSTGSGCSWTTSGLPSWITLASGSGSGSGNGTVTLNVQANTGAARSAAVTIAGQSFTVNQAAATACTYSLNPTTHAAPAAGGNTSVAVSTGAGCSWTTSGLPSWITLASGSGSGTGNGTVTLNVQANTGAARNATVTIAGQSFTVNQAAPAPTCAYSLNPTTHAAPAAGGQTSVTVTTSSGCSWTTSGVPSWITLTGGSGSGTGKGTVTLNVHENTDAARSATLTIAGLSFTVNQAAPAPTCAYTIAPETHSATASGGQTSVTVTTAAGCSWSTTGLPSWITFTSGTGSGSGNGTVNLTVQANTGAARSATLTIAGKSFTVNQAAAAPACSYTVTPTTFNVDEDQHAGQQALSIAVQTTSQCTWSATVTSVSPWLTIRAGATGTGNGTVLVDVERNRDPARTGTLTVAGRTVTINQAGGSN